MADPVFNDFYYVPQPELQEGVTPDPNYGAPDFDPTGIVIAFGDTTLSPSPTGWQLL